MFLTWNPAVTLQDFCWALHVKCLPKHHFPFCKIHSEWFRIQVAVHIILAVLNAYETPFRLISLLSVQTQPGYYPTVHFLCRMPLFLYNCVAAIPFVFFFVGQT